MYNINDVPQKSHNYSFNKAWIWIMYKQQFTVRCRTKKSTLGSLLSTFNETPLVSVI